MTSFDRPIVEITIAAPADIVWNALRDPARIEQWFGWDADTLPGEIDFIFVRGAFPEDEVRVLRFKEVEDRFEVVARGQTSLLRVVRPADDAAFDWDDVFDGMVQGWISFARQLKMMLERHPNERRRTVYLEGRPKTETDELPMKALRVHAFQSVGAAYAVNASGSPEEMRGKVWHRGRHQIGLTVDAWGDGLLIAVDRPASEAHPRGGTQLTLTTYGLGDEDFAALRRRWERWFGERYEPAPAS